MMSRIPETPIKKAFMEAVGFINWAVLDDSITDTFFYDSPKVAIMPDVNSLHVFADLGDGEVMHQILDYPYYDGITLEDFFDEVLESFEGSVPYATVEEAASEDGCYRRSKKNPTLTKKELEWAYQRAKGIFDLVAILEGEL